VRNCHPAGEGPLTPQVAERGLDGLPDKSRLSYLRLTGAQPAAGRGVGHATGRRERTGSYVSVKPAPQHLLGD
jgi:hypothetical protein